MSVSHSELLSVAHQLANAAEIETLKWFRATDLVADNKEPSHFDPVTQADRAAEVAMREVLARLRPDDAILGEEFDAKPGTTGLTWVLDPIDGTRGYMAGTPTWGTLIAVGPETGPEVGMIHQPYIGERFVGAPGRAVLIDRDMNGRDIQVRGTTSLSDAVIFTTYPEVGTAQDRQGFDAVAAKCKLTRFGMDCYAYALLAAGQIDLVVEAGLQAYDIQAPIAVIHAAGGIVTNWSGDPVHNGGQALAAATPELHAAALTILKDFAND